MSSSRRAFLNVGVLSAASYRRVLGANDRVQLGFIGCGIIARRHLIDFRNQNDVDIVATCDAYMPRAEQCVADFSPRAKAYQDFRRVLENKDIQAVCISTPDHWHALMTIMACAAGKDVYVEKPLTVFVKEGRWMIEAARRYKRVVQVGTQQRSGRHYPRRQPTRALARPPGKNHQYPFRVCAKLHARLRKAGRRRAAAWDELGPVPRSSAQAPLQCEPGAVQLPLVLGLVRGATDYMGAHEMDILVWALQVKGPTSVVSFGGRHALQDNCEVPDTQDSLFEFPGGCTAVFSYREACAGRGLGAVLQFYGTKGSMDLSRSGYRVYSDTRMPRNGHVPAADKQPRDTAGWPDATPESREPGTLDGATPDVRLRTYR